MNATKADLRRSSLKRRDAVSKDDASRLSVEIQRRFLKMGFMEGALKIALYSAIGNEVATDLIFAEVIKKGIKAYFPRVMSEDGKLAFFEAGRLDNLRSGFRGIKEPSGLGEGERAFDVIVVPGVAFDATGFRLGFGKGFYDRFLKRVGGKRIALAYDFQVLDCLPRGRDDVKCDFIVTESRVIECISP